MSRQLITFELDDHLLGIDVMAIREIRAWSPVTPLPNAPRHVQGVVNLRGSVVPVLDLRERLGWGRTVATPRHAIIVLEIGDQLEGIIVDAVSDIVSVTRDDMQPTPDIGSLETAGSIEGLFNMGDKMVMLLSLAGISHPPDTRAVAQAA